MRIVRWVAVALVLLVLGGIGAGGWYYSDVLREDGLAAHPPDPPEYDLEVLEVGPSTIALPRTPAAEKDGVWGLRWEEGYARLGPVIELTADRVVRRLEVLGSPPRAGQAVSLDAYAFAEDPRAALGLPFRSVTFPSQLGELTAWLVEGDRSTWVIFVHGKGAELRESLRVLPVFAELGLPILVISYRNDPGAPLSADGLHHFGRTEWRDLQAAVDYARGQGAQGLILVGSSMGGAVVVNFLYEGRSAGLVRGVVLDAPVVDFGATVDWEAERRGIPRFLTTLAKAISAVRFGISWSAMDLVGRSDRLTAPVLVFHGEEDETVPFETSRTLAEARPDLVTLVPVPGAGHGESWNMDPISYEASVREFVKRVEPGD